MNNLNKKIINATKWSFIAEIVAKLIQPITTMILARLLVPEVFGIIATVIMIFSFADLFSDAGFQKYLIQQEFKDEDEMRKTASVAFWTNLAISLLCCLIILIFSEQLAKMTGNPGYGILFIVSSISLPLTSLSSIQIALYRRKLEFRILFFRRILSLLIPFFITVPLAYFTRNYWSLIIGTIVGELFNAVYLTIKSTWRPQLFFDMNILKKMFSFSMWSLAESLLNWFSTYIGVFIVGAYLSSYYLGIYKTSINTVNAIMAIVTSATTPILYSSLSRIKDDKEEFSNLFFKFQRNVGILVIPMGFGIYVFRSFITQFFLGNQWGEAADFIGLWGLIYSWKIIFNNYCTESFRAKGMPRLSVIALTSQIILLIPVLHISAQQGFKILYISRSFLMIQLIFVNLFLAKHYLKISPIKMMKNLWPAFLASILMAILGTLLLTISQNFFIQFLLILICIVFYFFMLSIISPSLRNDIIELILSKKVNFKIKK